MKSDSEHHEIMQQKKSAEQTMRTVKNLCKCGMMAAVIAMLSFVIVPLPVGIPITLQTFAVALCGYLLGSKDGVKAVGVYLLLGAVGLPVFSGMHGGISVLTGMTGGYLYGFLPMAAFCGLGRNVKSNDSGIFRKILPFLYGYLGLILCHIAGTVQLAFLTGRNFTEALAVGSLPYLLKDMISVTVAKSVSLTVHVRVVRGQRGRQ